MPNHSVEITETERSRLVEIKARVDAANQGTWKAVEFVFSKGTNGKPDLHRFKLRPLQTTPLGSFLPKDADFLANSREDVKFLLDLIEKHLTKS